METFYLFYLKPALEYAVEMLPSVLAAAAVFFCLRPRRRGRLAARGLRSGPCAPGAGAASPHGACAAAPGGRGRCSCSWSSSPG